MSLLHEAGTEPFLWRCFAMLYSKLKIWKIQGLSLDVWQHNAHVPSALTMRREIRNQWFRTCIWHVELHCDNECFYFNSYRQSSLPDGQPKKDLRSVLKQIHCVSSVEQVENVDTTLAIMVPTFDQFHCRVGYENLICVTVETSQ